MTTRFIHTADWQLGKPFAGVQDATKRAVLQQERIAVLARISAAVRAHRAEFVIVAGDAFDSTHATKATVAAACSAIRAMQVPVFMIPGNHDHGGPGSLWEQSFFRREAAEICPNLSVLLSSSPVETETALLFPCPLSRRHDTADTTLWLRSASAWANVADSGKPRIVIAHGSTQSFGSAADDEEGDESGHNLLDLTRLPPGAYDYIALGDWHGTKQVSPSAWYAGTPELDRFQKGADHDPGNVLAVVVERGAPAAQVQRIPTARMGWHQLAVTLADDDSVRHFAVQLETLLGQRAGEDLLHLELEGSLGLEATTRLEHLLESYEARLLRLKLINRTLVAPSTEEIAALTTRASDPLIARVATQLVARAIGETEDAAIARVALRELHAQIQTA